MGLTGTSVGLRLSELAPGVVQSEIRAMTQECDRMGGVNLAQGVCDTEVPEVVAEGAIRAIRERWGLPLSFGSNRSARC
jgi:aminotransferase